MPIRPLRFSTAVESAVIVGILSISPAFAVPAITYSPTESSLITSAAPDATRTDMPVTSPLSKSRQNLALRSGKRTGIRVQKLRVSMKKRILSGIVKWDQGLLAEGGKNRFIVRIVALVDEIPTLLTARSSSRNGKTLKISFSPQKSLVLQSAADSALAITQLHAKAKKPKAKFDRNYAIVVHLRNKMRSAADGHPPISSSRYGTDRGPKRDCSSILIKPGADLSNCDLTGIDLSGAEMGGVNLSGAVLTGVNLSGANFSGADLSGANLSGANLTKTNFAKVNLSGADLSGSNMSKANLSKTNLTGATCQESI